MTCRTLDKGKEWFIFSVFFSVLLRVRKKRPSRRSSVMVILEADPRLHQITQCLTGAPASHLTLSATTSCLTENTFLATSTDTSECKMVDTQRHAVDLGMFLVFIYDQELIFFFCLSCVSDSKMVRRWCIYLCCLLMSSATGSRTLW